MHLHEFIPSRRPRLPMAGAIVLVGAWTLGGAAWGDNGDVLLVSDLLAGKSISDIVYDPTPIPPSGTGSFWVLERFQEDRIYHVSADLSAVLGTIPNPHETGQIPNIVQSVGIAYRPLTQSLFVLAQVPEPPSGTLWLVREVKTADGTETPEGMFTITPPEPAPALKGLKYDFNSRLFWYLDANNDILVSTDFTGQAKAVCSLPGNDPPEVALRGDGLSFELEEGLLYASYGDIFRENPSRIIQVDPLSCEATGVEIPLTSLPFARPLGFQAYKLGLEQRRIVIVSAEGQMAEIEQVTPSPVPPSQVTCALTVTNKVDLTWKNNGSVEGGAYGGEIRILRNGVPFTVVPGSATSFTDATPIEGTSTYALEASEAGGAFSPPSFPCEITVGVGGIVRWAPFTGGALYDVARNPETGDLFVTDNIGTAGRGKILRYDSALSLVGEVPSPWDRPGCIAFIPSITISSVTLTNVLGVGRTDGLLLAIIDLEGNEKTTLSLQVPEDSQPGSLTYIPSNQEFALHDKTSQKIMILDQNGRWRRDCVPGELFGFPDLAGGLTYDPIQDSFLAIFADGWVREITTGSIAAPLDAIFPLTSTGEGFSDPASFLGGIQIAGNTLVVLGRESRALFVILIFPFSPPFKRGDFDRNDTVNVTDVIGQTSYLFQDGPAPICQDAADTNDDAVIDLSDPVYLLFHLFLQGPPPPDPFTTAGTDPTFRDNLGCDG